MPNEENLIKNLDLTPTERRERASKAGKASGVSRRRRKAMRKVLDELMTLPPNSKEAQAALEGLGLLEDADNQTAMLAGLMKQAMTGDTKAVQEVRNILGDDRDSTTEKAERKARIEHTHASTAVLRAKTNTEEERVDDDGFLAALTCKAVEDWSGE